MASDVRSEMEESFGRDLSQVRIHTGGDSVQMNQNLQARAFTHKNDIYFNSGEYNPSSSSGKFLLAHELTHTVQQGAGGDMVQRFSAPEQDVSVEPKPARPDDGGEVTGRMNEKIANDENVQNQDDLSDEEREEKKKPDRGEVRQESGEIKSSGEAKPSVDRGAQAEEKTTTQKEQLQQELQQPPPEGAEKKDGKEGKKAPLTPAQAAAQRAQAAQARAYATPIPEEPQPFRHPSIKAPVDSKGEPLPRNSQIDAQVRGLGYIAEVLRGKGYEMKRHAARQEIASYGLDSVLEREREDLARAREGTATMDTHNQSRQEIAEKSREAHGESVERQQFVAEKAPDLASKADEGAADSGELAAEAGEKAGRSRGEIPDDEDARGDAEQQSGELQETAQGAESMDQAIRQSGERARKYAADAEAAAQQNVQSEARITETEEVISKTQARITEMQATNEASQAKIDNASPGPDLIRQFAQQDAESGDELIAATIVMEDELNALQEEYLSGMAGIESRKEAIERQQKEQEESGKDELSPEERQLFELAGMDEAEQEQHVASMSQTQRDGLLATLDRMIKTAPDQGTDATEGARLKVDTGLGKAISGEPPPDPRAEQIQEVENRRIKSVGEVTEVANQNWGRLTDEQKRMVAQSLVAASISDGIKSINVLQMGEAMLKGMIDPRQSLAGVAGGFDKMLTGFANIGNWDAWRKDPLGNLLQIAADITTGLATIFSSILGLAALVTAVMVALTIISWGFLSFITAPVISWMGVVMTYAGWGAIITGGLAVYFNYLAYLKNLHDAGTAQTAQELFGNTEQMKQNATDGFQGAMAVVEGVGAVKMGPKLSSGEFFSQVPRSPGAFLLKTGQGIKRGAISLAKAPGRLGRGIRDLFAGGKQGLIRFKERVQGIFSRRRPGRPGEIDIPDTPRARQQHQTHLDDARGKRVKDMNPDQFGAEMREAGKNRPKRIEPGSEHFDAYDIEIEANGHTYRRRKDGKGWCRFSPGPEECGIGEGVLPDKVKEQSKKFDTDATATSEKATGKQQAAANGWPENPPEGYEWYTGPDGKPMVRNKPGHDGPVLEYDPVGKGFVEKTGAKPKPDVRAIEGEKARLAHSDLDNVKVTKVEADAAGKKKVVEVDARERLKELEGERTAAQSRKHAAQQVGDEAAASKAHGEMVRASEELGEVATDAAVKKQMPNAQRLESELPGGQKSGEFDRIYENGDDVYIAEGKGAGSQRGSRKTSKGLRAEQGTPEYRDDIIRNMEEKVDAHTLSDAYKKDPQFKARVDELQRTVDKLKAARDKGKLHYAQVNQKVDVAGKVKPEIEITPFDPKKSEIVSAK